MSDKSIYDAIQARDLNKVSEMIHNTEKPMRNFIDIVFDGPPGHESGRFVEVEDEKGASFRAGEWIQRPDGFWALRLTAQSAFSTPPAQFTNCDICDKNPGHREMNASGVEGVICESCDEKLWREQR